MGTDRLRLAIDMDEVIADAFTAQKSWYCETHGYDWNDEVLQGRHFNELANPEHAAEMETLLHRGEFFRGLNVMPGAQNALLTLSERFEIFITTAAMEYPASCAAKFGWLQEHFPFISPLQIVFCGDKSILAADYLIDDNVRHFSRFKGQGILFSAAHNQYVDWTPRVKNWTEAVSLLDGLATH
ncbi:hypothetical protein IFJ82_01725 [Novacetimonas hansenii]|uniref:5' nucleotidase, NT5C type n=1 Tax=Novacetimonas hansenii TaxID=436 RepID=UPI0017806ECD|nr:hypothetical protein [Novacetimonas hansenii]MBL7237842.1 hypothetical protein [Novacetimonas hansenii]QOF95447.1 hypothetical protein IFJ82_01725 [Novacetimonas hansenii]